MKMCCRVKVVLCEKCLVSAEHRTAFLLISHICTLHEQSHSRYKYPQISVAKWHLFLRCLEKSTETSTLLSTLTSSGVILFTCKWRITFCMCWLRMCKQGQEHNSTNKQEKKGRKNMQCYFVSNIVFRSIFIFVWGEGGSLSLQQKQN